MGSRAVPCSQPGRPSMLVSEFLQVLREIRHLHRHRKVVYGPSCSATSTTGRCSTSGQESAPTFQSSMESSCGNLSSRAESSSTLTSLNVSTRTDFTKRSERYTSH